MANCVTAMAAFAYLYDGFSLNQGRELLAVFSVGTINWIFEKLMMSCLMHARLYRWDVEIKMKRMASQHQAGVMRFVGCKCLSQVGRQTNEFEGEDYVYDVLQAASEIFFAISGGAVFIQAS